MDRSRFLEKARNLHGYKYEYIDLSDKIKVSDTIKVKFDGVVYYQRVIKHLNGRCPEKVIYKKTTEEYILEAKEVWGDKYDYSKINYINTKDEVEIVCKKHGSFLKQPAELIKGNSCPQCKLEKSKYNNKELFIEENKIPYRIDCVVQLDDDSLMFILK
jgi:hypothetical protein